MKINYSMEYYEYKNRYRNLEFEAKGVTKSEKFFPVFLNRGKEEIFKPLSKTKPLLTPFFAYSEVFWSNVINNYFDQNTPIYRLAICEGYEEEVPKYNNHGTIVPSIVKRKEKLVNLLEYFKEYKDPSVDIDNYVNFCMKMYDYTDIFNSKIFSENINFGEQLALQVLISILRADQNYHYENVAFIFKDGKPISLAPPIDHEFSTMFLYMDSLEVNKIAFQEFLVNFKEEPEEGEDIVKFMLAKDISPIRKNIDLIVERYEGVVIKFLQALELFIYDLENNDFNLQNQRYLYPFNTSNFRAGMALYKNNNEEAYQSMLSDLKQYVVQLDVVSSTIIEEILLLAKTLQNYLIERLEIKHQKTLDFK